MEPNNKGTPIYNAKGYLCGLCDSSTEHYHPTFSCHLCGSEGLSENWDRHILAHQGKLTPTDKRG